MKREITLTLRNMVSGWGAYIDPGTSPYPWLGNVPTVTLAQAWSDGVDGTYAFAWPDGGIEHLCDFEPGPTLCLFEKLVFECAFDYSQKGPNNWWFPPNNAAGPGMKIVMRRRDLVSYYDVAEYRFLETDDNNVNINTSPVPFKLHTLTGELTSHPDGGPFTLDDINHLVAGVRALYSNGPNGAAYDNSAGSFFKIRVPRFSVTATVQDLGGFVDNVRAISSSQLRMRRRARNTIVLPTPAVEAPDQLHDVALVTHALGPSSAPPLGDPPRGGWGTRLLERRPTMILQRTYWPEKFQVVDEGFDLHDYACNAWAALRIPIAWTPELSGLAYLDQGGGFTVTRAQDAWSLRPGDGAAVRVLEGYANLSEDGLAVHAAGAEEQLLQSGRLSQSPWANSDVSGGCTIAAETAITSVDELGYRNSSRLTFGGTPGTGGRAQTFGALTAGDVVQLRARVRVVDNDDPATKKLEFAFWRTGGLYWNATTRTWDAGPVYNEIPADAAFGELVSDDVPIPTTGTYNVKVGRFSSAINTATFVVGLVSVLKGGAGCGMPLVTLASKITREADRFELDNSGAACFHFRDRGMVTVEARPFFRSASLAGGAVKPLYVALHASGAYERVDFVAGPARIVFSRANAGGANLTTVTVNLPRDITRGDVVRCWARWLGADAWRESAPYEMALGVALFTTGGTFVDYSTGAEGGAFTPDGTATDVVVLGSDGTDYFDGWLRTFETKRNPVAGEEAVWRR